MGIVERLRSDGEDERQRFREARATLGPLLADAAAEIERLLDDNSTLRTQLKLAVWEDTNYCASLEEQNETFRKALMEIRTANDAYAPGAATRTISA
ncbi:MAG: hypothetical protein RJA94_3670, partial [Pseudomonadota bacterium]